MEAVGACTEACVETPGRLLVAFAGPSVPFCALGGVLLPTSAASAARHPTTHICQAGTPA